MADSTHQDQKKDGKKPVIILGAGLAGSLLSCFMVQRGFTVEMYERRPDMRKTEMSAGRSINLAMSERGLSALSKVGLRDDILKIAIPMKGRMMHSIDGKMTFQPYSKDMKSAIYSISRGQLNCLMMDLAEKNPNIHIHFNYKTTDVNLKSGQVTLKHEQTKEIKQVVGETILASDGAFSVARGVMMKQPRFNYSQDYLEHGYKELTIPPDENGKHRLDSNCLHIWPRGGYMMIALPNLDGSFTVTCFFPHDEGEASFAHLDKADDQTILDFFKKVFPDALAVMPTLLHDWRANPTSVLLTVRCKPWFTEDKCCLVGDACHAIVPFFGQGMNAAFEDCAVLNECIDEFGTEWKKVFARYQDLRKENADSIATMALENFIEMRDKVADPHFLFKKKVEHKLGNAFPAKFLSRYEMVSFTTYPYKEALRRGLLNDKICEELMKGIEDLDAEKVDLKKAEELINKYL